MKEFKETIENPEIELQEMLSLSFRELYAVFNELTYRFHESCHTYKPVDVSEFVSKYKTENLAAQAFISEFLRKNREVFLSGTFLGGLYESAMKGYLLNTELVDIYIPNQRYTRESLRKLSQNKKFSVDSSEEFSQKKVKEFLDVAILIGTLKGSLLAHYPVKKTKDENVEFLGIGERFKETAHHQIDTYINITERYGLEKLNSVTTLYYALTYVLFHYDFFYIDERGQVDFFDYITKSHP